MKGIMLTGTNIGIYRLITLQSMLELEIKGMGRRGRSAYSIIKQELDLKGNRASVLEQVGEYIEAAKEIVK
jgi:hypothetical protein